MSEIKLTHKQASQLRCISLTEGAFVFDFVFPVGPLVEAGLVDVREDRDTVSLSTAGRTALAAYDAAWVTVQRSDLREVLDLLNTFFGFPEDSGGGRLMAALEAKC